jgi:hypothetical protein
MRAVPPARRATCSPCIRPRPARLKILFTGLMQASTVTSWLLTMIELVPGWPAPALVNPFCLPFAS